MSSYVGWVLRVCVCRCTTEKWYRKRGAGLNYLDENFHISAEGEGSDYWRRSRKFMTRTKRKGKKPDVSFNFRGKILWETSRERENFITVIDYKYVELIHPLSRCYKRVEITSSWLKSQQTMKSRISSRLNLRRLPYKLHRQSRKMDPRSLISQITQRMR